MKFHFYLEKLEESEEYKKFISENPSAVLCGAFFSIDKKGSDEKQHFDFSVGEKMFSFQLEENTKLVPVEGLEGVPVPAKIIGEPVLSFEEIEKLIQEEMEKQNITNGIQKILTVLQNKDSKDFWVTTVFISGMGIISSVIDDVERKVSKFEKKSLLDMIKRVK